MNDSIAQGIAADLDRLARAAVNINRNLDRVATALEESGRRELARPSAAMEKLEKEVLDG